MWDRTRLLLQVLMVPIGGEKQNNFHYGRLYYKLAVTFITNSLNRTGGDYTIDKNHFCSSVEASDITNHLWKYISRGGYTLSKNT